MPVEESSQPAKSPAAAQVSPAPGEAEAQRRHLSTDHLQDDLKARTVSGTLVTTVAQGAQIVLNLVSIVVLARLLTPSDFGLFAMVGTLVSYLRVFKDAGLSTATIQRQGITHAQVSNLFWVNVAISGAVTLIFAAAAPLIAWFYKDQRLVAISIALSMTFLLNGLAVQHTALLNRQMRFVALGFIQVTAMLIGVGSGILLAWWQFNYWALVISNLAVMIATALFTWIAIPWRPQWPKRRTGTRPLIGFGANMAASGFIYSLARGSDSMLIGRIYGADPLGLYSRASALLARPLEQLMSPVGSVFVTVLSRLQTHPERYRRVFLRVYEALCLASALGSAVLLALARPLTLVILGRRWEQAAVIFAGFTIAAIFTAPATASTWLFASQGRGREWLVTSSLLSGVAVASFLAGLPFGPAGVAISYSAAGILVVLPTLYYLAGRTGPVTTADLWTGLLRYLPVLAIGWGATYAMRLLVAKWPPLLQVLICGAVGLTAGLFVTFAIPQLRRTALELAAIVKELLSRKRSPDKTS